MDRHPEADEEPQDLGDPAQEVDARRPLLGEVDRDLADLEAGALGPDHQLGGEDVVIDDAGPGDRQDGGAAQRLEAVGVGAVEAEGEAEEAVVAAGRQAAEERPAIVGAAHRLRADHDVDVVRVAEDRQGADVEVVVAEVDLLAEDEAAAGGLEAAAEGEAVVGRGDREGADPRARGREVGGLAGCRARVTMGYV